MSNEPENTNVSQEAIASSEQKIATPFHFPCSPTVHIGAGVALFLVGGLVTMLVDPYLPTLLSNTKKSEARGHTLGFAEARAKVEANNIGKAIKAQSNSLTISGTITKIGGGKVTIHDNNPVDPFADPALLDRTVIINASTTFRLVSEKAPAKKTKLGDKMISVPIVTQSSILLSDLRVGDSVGIFLSSKTINLPEPTALAIQVTAKKAVPAQ